MRMLLLFGAGALVTGCGYISEDKMTNYLDGDGDGLDWSVDCDDNDKSKTTPSIWYLDEDGDGYGVEDNFVEACVAPEGTVTDIGDCNDQDASVYPNAEDIPYDGIDSNCDNQSDCDLDGDGYDGSDDGGRPTEGCPNASDCDDSDPNISPDASVAEVFYNGIDDDCDTTTGDGDADGDGYWHKDYERIAQERGFTAFSVPVGQEGDCFDSIEVPVDGFDAEPLNDFEALAPEQVSPEAQERFYDGIDQNCDEANDFDQDLDGFSSSEYQDRTGALGTDCVDSVEAAAYRDFGIAPADIYPNADDSFYDGVDQNCDGSNDFDQDLDGFDVSLIDCDGDGTAAEGTCDFDGDGVDDFVGGSDCNDSDSEISIDAEEIVNDDIDQNCDTLELCYLDADGDGFGSLDEVLSSELSCLGEGIADNDDDCDDNRATVKPDAAEICDGVINDCYSLINGLPANEADDDGDKYVDCEYDAATWVGDSTILGGSDCDDGNAQHFPGQSWYPDVDGDGFGNSASGAAVQSCAAPDGAVTYLLNNTDCDDDDADRYPGQSWYPDADEDGFGDATAVAEQSCLVPTSVENAVVDHTDCDDDDDSVYPDAPELCDGQYNDCDDSAYAADSAPATEQDGDEDTYVACEYDASIWVGAAIVGGGDCDDGNAAVHPDATELENDGIDQNCDSQELCPVDGDGDGFGHETSTGLSASLTCEETGFSNVKTDCNDDNIAINPDASEIKNDGVDQNCDSQELCPIDADGDGFGHGTSTGLSDSLTCEETGFSNVDTDCDDGNEKAFPGAALADSDSACMLDVDGDDYGDAAPDNAAIASGTDCDDGNTRAFPGAASSDSATDCMVDADGDSYGDVAPENAGIISGSDCDDSNGNAFPGAASLDSTTDCMLDVDGDDYGDAAPENAGIIAGSDCNDGNGDINPSATEIENDGVDQDCDNQELCPVDGDVDGFGASDGTTGLSATLDCSELGFSSNTEDCNDGDQEVYPKAFETPDDIDDNCDGLEETEIKTCMSVTSEDRYFLICNSAQSWVDANIICQNGGYSGLASILTAQQNLDVSNQMKVLMDGQVPTPFWHGYYDRNNDDVFSWTNEDQDSYNYWASAHPTEGTDDCGQFSITFDVEGNYWESAQCDAQAGFVCSAE